MRRDIGFYIEANIEQVYNAYLKAAQNKPFERDCSTEPYHTISFGVNFSMKYNMNGGSCNIHLMPWGTGTAVDMRFSIAQLAGAHYERYAHDLNTAMQAFLPVVARPAEYNMDDFLKPENQVTPATLPKQAAPAAIPAATPAAAPTGVFCSKCGNPLAPNGRFCSQCGTPVQRVCPNCQAPASSNAAFCTACGTRL